MPSIGPLEIVVVLAIALLVFGPNRLPEMGRNVGRALRQLQGLQHDVRGQFEGVFHDNDDDEDDDDDEVTEPSASTTAS